MQTTPFQVHADPDNVLIISYDGDPMAPEWPITFGGHVMAQMLNEDGGYRVRREAGGMAHVSPLRSFPEQALNDFERWLNRPMDSLNDWTEDLTV